MANDAPACEVIPQSSPGINQALIDVRDGEAGALPGRTDTMRDDDERG
jgi:hypothetical protein